MSSQQGKGGAKGAKGAMVSGGGCTCTPVACRMNIMTCTQRVLPVYTPYAVCNMCTTTTWLSTLQDAHGMYMLQAHVVYTGSTS
jgi:hypothetical protein